MGLKKEEIISPKTVEALMAEQENFTFQQLRICGNFQNKKPYEPPVDVSALETPSLNNQTQGRPV